VQLAYNPVVKLCNKCVLAYQFTSSTSSSTRKTYIFSWLPASMSELSYQLLLMREQNPSKPCHLCKYALIYSGKELTFLEKEVIGVSGSWVKGPLPAVASAPRGTVLQSDISTSSVSLQEGHVVWVISAGQTGKSSFLILCTIPANLLYLVLTLSSLLLARAVSMYLTLS